MCRLVSLLNPTRESEEMRYLFLAFFGLIGIFGRYFTGTIMASLCGANFPVATMAINIVGSFLMGIIYTVDLSQYVMSEDLKLSLMVGFLGGFTTFSTFSLDTVTLFSDEKHWDAFIYIAGNVGGSLIATAIGIYLGKQL
jgi:CrcB protein